MVKSSLINSNGEVKKKLSFSLDDDTRDMNNYSLLNSKALNEVYPIVDEVSIIVPRRNPSFKNSPPDSILGHISLFTKITEDGERVDLKVHPPDFYFSGTGHPFSNTVRSYFVDNKLYYSFSSDPIVYYYDQGNVNSVEVSTKEPFEFEPLGIKKFNTWRCINFEYGNLYVDDKAGYIYRLAKYPKLDEVKDCEREELFPYKFSVIITTLEGKAVLEKVFTGSIYSFIHGFLYNEGFYLLRSPFHPEYEEEILAFDRYVVSI